VYDRCNYVNPLSPPSGAPVPSLLTASTNAAHVSHNLVVIDWLEKEVDRSILRRPHHGNGIAVRRHEDDWGALCNQNRRRSGNRRPTPTQDQAGRCRPRMSLARQERSARAIAEKGYRLAAPVRLAFHGGKQPGSQSNLRAGQMFSDVANNSMATM